MPRRKRQRGVLLLIVLSLLVLFVLIGITFIVVAGQYTKAAKAYSRHELKGDPPAKELDGALMQLLRGTSDPHDLMYRHNLMRDVYGVDGFEGIVLNVAYGGQNGQQFLAMQFGDVFGGARPTDHYYAGSVLTLLDGQGTGQSTRIVGYRAPTLVNGTRAGLLYLQAFEDLPPGFTPAPARDSSSTASRSTVPATVIIREPASWTTRVSWRSLNPALHRKPRCCRWARPHRRTGTATRPGMRRIIRICFWREFPVKSPCQASRQTPTR